MTETNRQHDKNAAGAGHRSRTEAFCALIRHILHTANLRRPRSEFLDDSLTRLREFAACRRAELRLIDRRLLIRAIDESSAGFRIETETARIDNRGHVVLGRESDGSRQSLFDHLTDVTTEHRATLLDNETLLAVPFDVHDGHHALLILSDPESGSFISHDSVLYEEAARVFGTALAHRDMQVDLRERVKELTCLYGMARIAADPGLTLGEVLRKCVALLPPGWLYPEICAGRITLDGQSYETPDFPEHGQRLTAPVIVGGLNRGSVVVAYREPMPELDEGPFLKEERSLIDTIAGELALMVEQRHAEEEVDGLQEQLRHADRLATIGQLAAGVAHELNEPLGSILGFAQLAKKDNQLAEQTREDVGRIEAASLHAREVIKKLMLFARQTPPRKDPVDLNGIVSEGLYFLESRCSRAGVELIREPDRNLPEIVADHSLLYQVLVNLVVNAIQAMPDGGRLTIRTVHRNGTVSLVVEDTGVGMTPSVIEKALQPFFTTKDVNEGTGLGLAVAHGIVQSHGGEILIESETGKGSRFEVRLPVDPGEPIPDQSKDSQ